MHKTNTVVIWRLCQECVSKICSPGLRRTVANCSVLQPPIIRVWGWVGGVESMFWSTSLCWQSKRCVNKVARCSGASRPRATCLTKHSTDRETNLLTPFEHCIQSPWVEASLFLSFPSLIPTYQTIRCHRTEDYNIETVCVAVMFQTHFWKVLGSNSSRGIGSPDSNFLCLPQSMY
jgi:hypothetical protein